MQLLRRGLRVVRVDNDVQQRRGAKHNVEQFRSFFGPHPNQVAECWNDLIVNQALVPVARISLLGFFMALNFLRCYHRSEKVRSALFGNIELKRARELTWYYIQKIDELYQFKIFWPATFSSTFIGSVDGSNKRSTETRHPTLRKDPKRYSWKHHTAGHNVQVVLHCFENKIMDILVSRGGQNDMGNVNESDLLNKIPDGKRVVVDGGYTSNLDKFSGYNQFDSETLKEFKKRAKARHETINKRMNDYNALAQTWHHNIAKFPMAVRAVGVLIQYGLEDENPESGNPLFDV